MCLLRISWFIYHLLSSLFFVCRWVSDVLMIFQRKRSWHSISTKQSREPPGLTLWTFITGGVFQNEFHTSQTFYPGSDTNGFPRVPQDRLLHKALHIARCSGHFLNGIKVKDVCKHSLQCSTLWWSKNIVREFSFCRVGVCWRRHREDQSTLQNGLLKRTFESHFPFPWRYIRDRNGSSGNRIRFPDGSSSPFDALKGL